MADRLDVRELESTMQDLGLLLSAPDEVRPEIAVDEDPDSGGCVFSFEWPTTMSLYLSPQRRAELDEAGLEEAKTTLYDEYESAHGRLSRFLRGWADHIDANGIAVHEARVEGRRKKGQG